MRNLAARGGAVLAVGLLLTPPAARAAVTLKGRVVWDGGAVPKRAVIAVPAPVPACVGPPLRSDVLLINAKNKGVRYVLVWLTDATSPRKELPVPPALKAVPAKVVVIDQPCCMFEPHMVALRGGQTLRVNNSAAFNHNVDVRGGDLGPGLNRVLPPGGALVIKNLKARSLSSPIPIQVACGMHAWMKAWVAVMPTPYFAVTDADGNFEIKGVPVGKCRILMWHEVAGWVVDAKSPKRGGGRVITVGPGPVSDAGTFKLKLPKED